MQAEVYVGDLMKNEPPVKVEARFNEKFGNSPYVVLSASLTPSKKDDIIDFFMAPSVEIAVKTAVRKFYTDMKSGKRIAIMTGDGQVVELTLVKG